MLVSVSANRRGKQDPAQQPLQMHLVPMVILVEEPHFENLFTLVEELSTLTNVCRLISYCGCVLLTCLCYEWHCMAHFIAIVIGSLIHRFVGFSLAALTKLFPPGV